MPIHIENILDVTSTTAMGASRVNHVYDSVCGLYSEFDLNQVIKKPKNIESSREIKWRISHWNTKWNCYDCVVNKENNQIKFTTLDDPPFPVVEKLASKYPDLTFVLTSIHKEEQYVHKVIYRSGRMQGMKKMAREENPEEYDQYVNQIKFYDC